MQTLPSPYRSATPDHDWLKPKLPKAFPTPDTVYPGASPLKDRAHAFGPDASDAVFHTAPLSRWSTYSENSPKPSALRGSYETSMRWLNKQAQKSPKHWMTTKPSFSSPLKKSIKARGPKSLGSISLPDFGRFSLRSSQDSKTLYTAPNSPTTFSEKSLFSSPETTSPTLPAGHGAKSPKTSKKLFSIEINTHLAGEKYGEAPKVDGKIKSAAYSFFQSTLQYLGSAQTAHNLWGQHGAPVYLFR